MAAVASNSMAAVTVFMRGLPATNRAAVFSPLPIRTSLCSTNCKQLKENRRSSKFLVKASSSEESPFDASEYFRDLKNRWDGVENKRTVLLYGGGSIGAIWLASIVVNAVNSVPLLPKMMELVGLGYTGWFVYRYILFKSNRKELVSDIEELKKKISGPE